MSTRLVALDEGPDIPLDRAMIVVGRHPQCDARLDSLRVSRHHCCMTQDHGEVIVRDLGSTNGIRINGQRVEIGRLRPGDELSIAHIRYRLDDGVGHEQTLADHSPDRDALSPSPGMPRVDFHHAVGALANPSSSHTSSSNASEPISAGGQRLAAAVRELEAVAERYRLQLILQMPERAGAAPEVSDAAPPENHEECRPDSRH